MGLFGIYPFEITEILEYFFIQ